MRDDVCFEKENVTAILCSIQQQIVCIDLFLREILWWRWNRVGNRIQEFNNLRIMLKIQFGEACFYQRMNVASDEPKNLH